MLVDPLGALRAGTDLVVREARGVWARTDHEGGFKNNTPDGWLTSGSREVWLGSDNPALLGLGAYPAGYAAITKAVNLIVNRLSAAEWRITVEGTKAPTQDSDLWLTDPMGTRQDGRVRFGGMWPAAVSLPAPYFWGQWIRQALNYGMGWLAFLEDADGRPAPGSLFLLAYWQVEIDGQRRRIILDYGERIDCDADNGFYLNGQRFTLMELRNPLTPLDPTTGATLGTLAHHAAELGLIPAIAEYSMGTYAGAGVPSGYLKVQNPQLTPQQAKDLKREWMDNHGRSRSVAVLTSMVDYQAISISPIDAALADMKKLSLVDVANAYCVPIFMLGGPSGHSNVYSNVETEQKALWTHTLQPWARSIEATLNALLPRGKALSITMPSMTEIVGWEEGKAPPSVDQVEAAEESGALKEDVEDEMGVPG